MARRRVVAGWLAAAAMLAGAPEARAQAMDPGYLDQLMAPVALYPDQLLAQVLLCAGDSAKVRELGLFLKQNPQLKGSELQQAVDAAGFEPSFIALAPFPQVVELMAGNLTWTSQIGGAFAVDKNAVFDSIQRLRKQSHTVGNLKSTPQQKVETRTVEGGEQVIVIEPANPQVIYVPQYNPTVVYTQPATTTTVVVQEDDDDDEAVIGAMIGFTAGVAIGAAWNNNYYYGPYGYRGGAYMYGGGWNDWYDDRADAREDWYENREDAREDYADHREDMSENRSERAEEAREQRGERSERSQEQRTERSETRQNQRTERTETRGERSGSAQQQRTERQQSRSSSASTQSASSTQRSRGGGERSGTRSDAFSGYSSGSSTRSASERGQRSRSSSGRSSGGRSRSGGGGRRR